jgi:hypothetical protein
VHIVSTELAAMVDFEFRPGRPPERLARQLARADAAERERAARPAGWDQMAMVDLSRSRSSPALVPAFHPLSGDALRLARFSADPMLWASRLREIWSDRGLAVREAWSDRTRERRRRRDERRRVDFYDVDEDPALSLLALDYKQSEPWLWYQSEWLGAGEAPLFRQRRRLFLAAPSGHPEVRGLQVLLLPERGVGVATVWISDERWRSPWDAKNSLWGRGDYWAELLAPTGLLTETGLSSERNYVFLAVRVDAPDLTDVCRDEAAAVASWFTGGYEHESLERELDLVSAESNMSRRSYERLFMRWTDALALYNLDTVRSDFARDKLRRGEALPHPDFDRDYRLVRCRAAQLFEHCILARRIFRTDGRRIAKLSTKTSVVRSAPVVSNNWRQANTALSSFSQAEFEMVTAPPVRSVEAGDLIRAAIEHCGIPTLVDDTHRGYDLLERRLQWVRGQWLAVIAVCAFIANAVLAIVKP